MAWEKPIQLKKNLNSFNTEKSKKESLHKVNQ